MKSSILEKLDHLSQRLEEIHAMLADPAVAADQNQYRQLSVEMSELSPVVERYMQWQKGQHDLEAAQQMLEDEDIEMREMAAEEVSGLEQAIEDHQEALRVLLIPKDPNDERNVFLEIRAGTGGDEASLFAGDLFRMYSIYAEKNRWKLEVLSHSDGEHGGYKEIITRISGRRVYSRLKFESGAHRVQRVPQTETQARDGSIALEDLQGGTFTITNGGVFGSLVSTPLLNPPQSAILGMHTIKERPAVVDGEIVARPMMYLALSYDHRLVDGKDSVQFLVAIKETLEDPARLLLGL